MLDNSYIVKSCLCVSGGIVGYLHPTLPFYGICFFAVIVDCLTAWELAKRIKKKNPEANVRSKFESAKAYKVFKTLLSIYSLIVITYMIDVTIFPFIDMYLANFVAGAFCLWEVVSILENTSSENDATWAVFLQRFLVNKASRHIEDFKETYEQVKHQHNEDES